MNAEGEDKEDKSGEWQEVRPKQKNRNVPAQDSSRGGGRPSQQNRGTRAGSSGGRGSGAVTRESQTGARAKSSHVNHNYGTQAGWRGGRGRGAVTRENKTGPRAKSSHFRHKYGANELGVSEKHGYASFQERNPVEIAASEHNQERQGVRRKEKGTKAEVQPDRRQSSWGKDTDKQQITRPKDASSIVKQTSGSVDPGLDGEQQGIKHDSSKGVHAHQRIAEQADSSQGATKRQVAHQPCPLTETLKDEELLFWFKDALCMRECQKCLKTLIEEASRPLHTQFLRMVKGLRIPALSLLCCTQIEIDYDKKKYYCKSHQTCRGKLDQLNGFCPSARPEINPATNIVNILCDNCNHCDGVLEALRKNFCREGYEFSEKTIKNCDLTRLYSEPIEFAKLFVHEGQSGANTMDITAMISCVYNCRNCLTNLALEANQNRQKLEARIQRFLNYVRKNRNKIFHESCWKVSKGEFMMHTDTVLRLLDLFKSFKDISKNTIEQAKCRIDEIQNANFDITKDDKTNVLKDLIDAIREITEDLRSEIEELTTDISNHENQTLKDINHLTEKLDTTTTKMIDVQTTLNDMKSTLETYKDLPDLKPLVSSLEKSVQTAKKEYETIKKLFEFLHKNIEDNTKKIHDNSQKIQVNSQQIQDDRQQIQDNRQQIQEDRQQIQANRQQIQEDRQQIQEDRQQIQANRQQIQEYSQQIQDHTEQIQDHTEQIQDNRQQIQDDRQQIQDDRQQIQDNRQQIQEDRQQIQANRQQIQENSQQIQDDRQRIQDHTEQIQDHTEQIQDNRQQIQDNRQQIQDHTEQLEDIKLDLAYMEQGAIKQEKIPTEADLGKLVQYLKDGYENEKLQVLLPGFFKIPVCKIFSPVILIKKGLSDKESSERLSSDKESSERLSSYKDMFYHGEVQNKQLFLVGEAGAGKSTYSKHLVDVWRNKSETPQFEDPECLRQFQFVFHVSFRFAKATDSIHDMICDQSFDDENMKSVATYVLRHCPEKCLIITDGLDEWQCPPGKSTGRRGDIPGLPSRKGVEGCLTLITSRPWRLQALTTELERKSIYELDGLLTPEKLIKNMMEEMGDSNPKMSCRKFQYQVKRCNMNEIMKTPLLLITVLSIWDEDQSLRPSVCHNYIRIIESIILRADDEEHWSGDETRLRKPLVHNLDTLKTKWEEKSSTLPSCCQKLKSFRTFAGLIISLSHLAFDLLFGESTSAEQKLVFSKQDCKEYLCDEELNVCLGIGILSQSQTSRGRRKIESYSFIHKSFQEFLSALWFAGPDSADSVVRINERIREQGRLGDLELLIKFVCGLAPPEVGADILIYTYKHCDMFLPDFVLACSVESQHCNNTTHVYPPLPGIIAVQGSISMDKFRMLTDILKSPSSGLRCLDIGHLSLDHSSIDQLYQSLSCCVNLEYLWLVCISCSGDRRYDSTVLDLQKHHKLEKLTLMFLSVRTVLWPQVTNSCLRELHIIVCNNISPVLDLQKHHKLEKLTLWGLSVRTVLWPQVTNSCLRVLQITHCNNISPVLDLQNLHKLEQLRLWNLSVPTVLWPQVTNSCLRVLYINDLNLTHGGVEELCRTYEQYRQSEMERCEVRWISCVDHGTRCNSFKDLQEHIKSVNLP